MPSLIIYTCVTSNYDWILPPIWRSPSLKYICFTNVLNFKCKGWEIRTLPSLVDGFSPALKNRYCKMFPWKILPPHDWSIYIDANIRVISNLSPIVNAIHESNLEIAAFRHPFRSTIFQEADACKQLNKISARDYAVLDHQLNRYITEGMPIDSKLFENNVIIRSGHSHQLPSVMALWWEELKGGIKRDQISFPYVIWKTQTSIYSLMFSIRDENPYFRIVPHRRPGSISNYLLARQHHGLHWEYLVVIYKTLADFLRRLYHQVTHLSLR